MTKEEVTKVIKDIPLGSTVQLIKNSGQIIEATLASHEVSGTEKKDYGEIVVPALPPAIIVQNNTRFGRFRMEIDDIIKIAWVE